LAESPHIAPRVQGIVISLKNIKAAFDKLCLGSFRPLIKEGTGGLLVLLNRSETLWTLIKIQDVPVIVFTRNYLANIIYSIFLANSLKQAGAKLTGWTFNDPFLKYEKGKSLCTEIPILGPIPFSEAPDKEFVRQQAAMIGSAFKNIYEKGRA
jgi:dethiobiotin synthetase